jgi:hypothetical protein
MAVAAAFALNVHAANEIHSGDVNSMNKWYRNAGGLTDVDRATGLTVGTSKVGVAYDADVAPRTNMPRSEMSKSNIGGSYDADVATRTNMPRGQDAAGQTKEAGIEGTKSD